MACQKLMAGKNFALNGGSRVEQKLKGTAFFASESQRVELQNVINYFFSQQ